MWRLLLSGVLALCLLQGADALGAPDEIQVYTEETNDPGRFGLEQHINYTLHGTRVPDYSGQTPSHHVMQITPEFSYGITKRLEAGLYVPFAFAPGGYSFQNGLRARLKYIAPRQHEEDVFYGLNVEIGRDTLRTSDSISGMEIRPIIGFRDARWLVSFNPILTLGLAANVSHQPQFEPALKVTHRIGEGARAGLEYYGSYGSLTHLPPGNRFSHVVYAVADIEGGWDVNLGLGRGLANSTDVWVMKAIIALPFE